LLLEVEDYEEEAGDEDAKAGNKQPNALFLGKLLLCLHAGVLDEDGGLVVLALSRHSVIVNSIDVEFSC